MIDTNVEAARDATVTALVAVEFNDRARALTAIDDARAALGAYSDGIPDAAPTTYGMEYPLAAAGDWLIVARDVLADPERDRSLPLMALNSAMGILTDELAR